MSYTSERQASAGTTIVNNIYSNVRGGGVFGSAKYPVDEYYAALTGNTMDRGDSGVGALFNGNYKLDFNGTDYTIKNTTANNEFSITDLIAASLNAGYSEADIARSLNKAGISDPTRNNTRNSSWTTASVSNYNSSSTSIGKQLQSYFGNTATVRTLLDKNGVDYSYQVRYKDVDGTDVTAILNAADIKAAKKDKDGNITSDNLSSLLTKAGNLTSIVAADNNARANAQTQIDAANKVLGALNGNVGSNANTNRSLTQAEINAVRAANPGTDNLTAWNKGKDSNVANIVGNNLTGPNSTPELLQRASLAELQGYVDTINQEGTDTTLRNLNQQQQNLLNTIKQDPALYQSIIEQFRKDTTAGTIAGQRAANLGEQAKTADATYDEAANNLYSSLFGSENGQVDATRNNILSQRGSALDQFIQGQLDNAMEAARQKQTTLTDLDTAINALKTALDVDNMRYSNSAAERDAAANARSNDIINNTNASVNAETAANDAALTQIANMFGLSKDYLQNASNGSADVSTAVNTIMNQLNTARSGGGYKTVNTPEYQAAQQFSNKQYDDTVNGAGYNQYFTDQAINDLTRNYTLDDIINSAGLGDVLSKDKLTNIYNQYADEANKESDKIFNAAQRAYIASIAAGDAKTSEQLTRLAQTAGTGSGKGNLYAATTLANMYNQQRGGNITGLRLATDFQNQQSANQNLKAQTGIAADKTLGSYLGSGYDNATQGTVYGIKNLYDSVSAGARNSLGDYANKLMSTTQNLNNVNVQQSINNSDRLAKLAGTKTLANANAAANNVRNSATRNTYAADALAAIAQGNKTLGK